MPLPSRLPPLAPQAQFRREQAGGGVHRVKARLMLVDLAGSERASLAAPGSATQKQGSGINVGLLFLGTAPGAAGAGACGAGAHGD